MLSLLGYSHTLKNLNDANEAYRTQISLNLHLNSEFRIQNNQKNLIMVCPYNKKNLILIKCVLQGQNKGFIYM